MIHDMIHDMIHIEFYNSAISQMMYLIPDPVSILIDAICQLVFEPMPNMRHTHAGFHAVQ